MSGDITFPPGSRIKRILVRAGLILLGMLLASVIFGILPFQFVGLLLFGWITYLGRTIPELTFNPEITLDGIVALAIAVFGTHRILCWCAKHSGDKSDKWRFAWTLKLTVMLLLLFAISIAAVGIIHQIGWLCSEQKLIEMSGMSKGVIELSNIKQVAIAIRDFSDDHGGQFPKELEELFPKYISTHRLFFTRALDDDPPQPIIYYPGYTIRDDPSTIILTSPHLWNFSRGDSRVVVYLDASARFLPDSDFQATIQKQEVFPQKR